MYINIKTAGMLDTGYKASKEFLKVLNSSNISDLASRHSAFKKNIINKIQKNPQKLTPHVLDQIAKVDSIVKTKKAIERAQTAAGISAISTAVGYGAIKGHQHGTLDNYKQASTIRDYNDNIPEDTRVPASNAPADGPDYYDWQEYLATEGGSNTPDRSNHPQLTSTKVANILHLDASTRSSIYAYESGNIKTASTLIPNKGSKLLGAAIVSGILGGSSYGIARLAAHKDPWVPMYAR